MLRLPDGKEIKSVTKKNISIKTSKRGRRLRMQKILNRTLPELGLGPQPEREPKSMGGARRES